jgi:hypothetical protein
MYPDGQQVLPAPTGYVHKETKWRHNSQVYKLRFSKFVLKLRMYIDIKEKKNTQQATGYVFVMKYNCCMNVDFSFVAI